MVPVCHVMYVSLMFSLFLSVYHTVWMLHRAKTARLVITLYRHITDILPTHHQLSADCRSSVGRLLVCVLGETCRPTVGRQMADRRPTNGRWSANRQLTVNRQLADRFFGELFFTITEICIPLVPHVYHKFHYRDQALHQNSIIENNAVVFFQYLPSE